MAFVWKGRNSHTVGKRNGVRERGGKRLIVSGI